MGAPLAIHVGLGGHIVSQNEDTMSLDDVLNLVQGQMHRPELQPIYVVGKLPVSNDPESCETAGGCPSRRGWHPL